MGGKCVKLCSVHVSVCVWGGVVGRKCVKLCTAHVSVCVGGGVVGRKCVKLCTAHLSTVGLRIICTLIASIARADRDQ